MPVCLVAKSVLTFGVSPVIFFFTYFIIRLQQLWSIGWAGQIPSTTFQCLPTQVLISVCCLGEQLVLNVLIQLRHCWLCASLALCLMRADWSAWRCQGSPTSHQSWGRLRIWFWAHIQVSNGDNFDFTFWFADWDESQIRINLQPGLPLC